MIYIYIWYSYAWFNETCFITYMKIWCSLLLNPLQPSLWHLWHCLTCLSRCCCGGRCRGDMSQALGISGASKRSKGKCFFVNGYPTPLTNCGDVCFQALCGECMLHHFAICLVNLASCKWAVEGATEMDEACGDVVLVSWWSKLQVFRSCHDHQYVKGRHVAAT